MRKLCSLDFLNKEEFDTDVVFKDETPVFVKGDSVTPSVILKLYFQEVYKPKEPIELPKGVNEESLLSNVLGRDSFTDDIEEYNPLKIPFDKQHAKRVTQYSKIIAAPLNLSHEQVEALEVAAYFHEMGKITLNLEEAEKEDFEEKYTQATYDYLVKADFPMEEIAIAARDHLKRYEYQEYSLSFNKSYNGPLAYIISIANAYDEMVQKTGTKEDALMRLLKIGGKRFNIYLLHKFITTMKAMSDGAE